MQKERIGNTHVSINQTNEKESICLSMLLPVVVLLTTFLCAWPDFPAKAGDPQPNCQGSPGLPALSGRGAVLLDNQRPLSAP